MQAKNKNVYCIKKFRDVMYKMYRLTLRILMY